MFHHMEDRSIYPVSDKKDAGVSKNTNRGGYDEEKSIYTG